MCIIRAVSGIEHKFLYINSRVPILNIFLTIYGIIYIENVRKKWRKSGLPKIIKTIVKK